MRTYLKQSKGELINVEQNVIIISEVEVEMFLSGSFEDDKQTFYLMLKQKEVTGKLGSVYVERGNYYRIYKEAHPENYSFEKFIHALAYEGFIDLEQVYDIETLDDIFLAVTGSYWNQD